MAYTDKFYSDPFTPKKRSDRGDLLKDTEDTFYGGGQAQPRPTPTPTPKPVSLAMLGQPTGVLNGSQNAASRVTNQPQTGGSRFIGKAGIDLGPLYNDQGGVNPLPRGAVGAQGSPVFNRSLNGAQPQTQTGGAAGRMTHTEMAADIARRNLAAQGAGQALAAPQPTLTGYSWHQATGGVSGGNNAYARYNWSDNTATQEPAGSMYGLPRLGLPRSQQPRLGTPQDQSQPPTQYQRTPQGNINFNVPGGSMEDALSRTTPPGQDYNASTGQYIPSSTPSFISTTPRSVAQGSPQSSVVDELSQRGVRPGRYSDAAGPISQSGPNSFSYVTGSGSKVDIAAPPRRQNDGYGSAYG